jgi:hypothetical protein
MADPITPQFNTAEYCSKPGANTCRSCNQTINGAYYRVNAAVACPNCVQRLQKQIPKDSHGAFTRGLIFGIGGAILGLMIYATFGIVTGWVIGYLSLAVGYIVAKAILMGSGGMGGRRYQIAAVLLTYFAVSTAAIPIGVSQFMKTKNAKPLTSAQSSSPRTSTSAPREEENVSEETSTPAGTPDNPPARKQPAPSFGTAVGALLLLGLASPFLELASPLHGVMGLVILFVGLQIAWKLTAGKKVAILGPFGEAVPPPPLG